MTISMFDSSEGPGMVVEALRRDGAVIVTGLINDEQADAVSRELREPLDRRGLDSVSDFNGDLTRRLDCSLAVAPSSAPLLEHDMVVAVADAFLLPHAVTYLISSVNAIEVLPGEAPQVLHRDDSPFPINMAGAELMIGVIWALDDFTDENGATRVVPGSHRFVRSWHVPQLDNAEQAVMPKGSALFYLGSTWHGSGGNAGDGARLGLVTTYIVGWLRQEENQYLYNPPDIAARFSPRLRALLGYIRHGDGEDLLGSFSGDNPAWVSEPPLASWRADRGQIAASEEAKTQAGDQDAES